MRVVSLAEGVLLHWFRLVWQICGGCYDDVMFTVGIAILHLFCVLEP